MVYLRHPSRVLAANEAPYPPLLGIVAAQLQVTPACTISSYWTHPRRQPTECGLPVPLVPRTRTGGRDVAEEAHGGPVQRDRAAAGRWAGRAGDHPALKCSRRLVRQIRDGVHAPPDQPRSGAEPLWMAQVDWPQIIHDLGLGHSLKFLWEEKAQALTTYSNFWKQFYRKFPQCRQAAVTALEFQPGERVEVDYAGDTLEWVELSTAEIRKAYVFVAGLGFSQLLFAWAAEDTKSVNWLASHRRMFAFYGGVANVTVPDCLKQGVLKCQLYDPDLNPGCAELAAVAVTPASQLSTFTTRWGS